MMSNSEKTLPKVFIIILNYNGRKFIKNCLTSIFKIDYPNFEVVVVDNNSQDGSLELAKSFFPRATFIKNSQNLGFAAGNNIGIKYALEHMADWVVLLNQDTEVEPDFLRHMIKAGKKNDLGIVSPLIFRGDTSRIWFSGGKINWWRMRAFHERKNIEKINRDCAFITGCSMMIRKDVFARIGLLDEDFFLYWEDTDFSVRAKKAGFGLAVTPETHIKHYEKNDEPEGNKIYWLVISGLMFFQKNAPLWQKIWLVPYCFMRRTKNRRDLKRKKKNAYFVAKAYSDFKYHGKK